MIFYPLTSLEHVMILETDTTRLNDAKPVSCLVVWSFSFEKLTDLIIMKSVEMNYQPTLNISEQNEEFRLGSSVLDSGPAAEERSWRWRWSWSWIPHDLLDPQQAAHQRSCEAAHLRLPTGVVSEPCEGATVSLWLLIMCCSINIMGCQTQQKVQTKDQRTNTHTAACKWCESASNHSCC